MTRSTPTACLLAVTATLAACTTTTDQHPYAPPPPSAPIYTTSFPCQDISSPVQQAVCASPQLAALDLRMAAALHHHLGDDDLIQRDQVLASQRAWLIALGPACLPVTSKASTPATPPTDATACLAAQYNARIDALTAWPTLDVPWSPAPLANYVTYKTIAAADPALCAALTAEAPAALSPDGALDPARLTAATELAGSHAPTSTASSTNGAIAVDVSRAGRYAGYQIRARSVTVSAAPAPILDPSSIGRYAAAQQNDAGRFGTFASQTGDYGAIDVFTRGGHTLALLTDTIGFYSPANAGEAALAALFTLDGATARPTCLFRTYLKPPYQGTFQEQPSLGPWLALLDTLRNDPPDALPASDRQDTTELADETRWRLFNLPLVESAEIAQAGWTGWLRHRHDDVLDALFAWSQKSPQNKAIFDRLFALLRPAAIDLAHIYQQQQGLTPAQSEQATSIAIMENLYLATAFLAPGLDAGPADPASYRRYHPRYPILASPGS